jgi:hypothetical protein
LHALEVIRRHKLAIPTAFWLLATVAVGSAVAALPTQNQDNARQAVTLFLKSCVEYPGDRDGLRNWARNAGLAQLGADGADKYLHGLPGMVYDASTSGTRLVLVSEDSGSCSTFVPLADGPTVLDELERILRDSRVTLTVTGDKPDAKESKLLHREYTAAGARRQWQMLVSTVNDPAGGEAMLTANPW